jgi:predicted MPP superfamily phosphohydrolase
MARYIHASDLHGNVSILEHLANSCDNIDAVFLTGDFNGHNEGLNSSRDSKTILEKKYLPELKKEYANLLKSYNISSKNDLAELDENKQKEFLGKSEQLKLIFNQQAYLEGLNDFKKPLEKIAEKTKIYGVTGNHDQNIIKHQEHGLGKYVQFLDDVSGDKINDQVIQGFNGSYEFLGEYPEQFVPNHEGVPFNYSGLPTEEKAKKDGSWNNVKGYYESFRVSPEIVKQAHDVERKRLGNNKVDIALLHKGRQVKKIGISDVAEELFQRTEKFALVGHNHAPFVGYINGTLEINPGSNYFADITTNNEGYVTNVKLYDVAEK